jgi:hypothetical protein
MVEQAPTRLRIAAFPFRPVLGPLTPSSLLTIAAFGGVAVVAAFSNDWLGVVLFALIALYTVATDYRVRTAWIGGFYTGFASGTNAATIVLDSSKEIEF